MGKSKGPNPPRNEGSAGGLFINHDFRRPANFLGAGGGPFFKKISKTLNLFFLEDGLLLWM